MTAVENHFIKNLLETKDRNVFVMMPYQTEKYYDEIELAIRQTLPLHGLISRLAKDSAIFDDLWLNLTGYMDNCSIGIAIFEQIDTRSYNPNVSFEVGYMLGQSKPCLLLKEKRLPRLPTDLCGRLYGEFDVMDIKLSVSSAVSAWLQGKGRPLLLVFFNLCNYCAII